MTDLPAGLADDPFDYRVTTAGRVRISRGGRLVTTVAGADGAKLATRLADADDARTQHLLARATGNYKRGNERRG